MSSNKSWISALLFCAGAVVPFGQAFAFHHCQAGQAVEVVSQCAWAWNQDGKEAVDPWIAGNRPSARRVIVNPSDCASLTVTEVDPGSHGYVGVSCSLADNSEIEYWINPEFLSCGEGISQKSVATTDHSGVCQTDGAVALTSRVVEKLGEENQKTPALDDGIASATNVRDLMLVADKTLSVLSASVALDELAKKAAVPAHAQIARELLTQYRVIQEARDNDIRLITSDYIDLSEDSAKEHLKRSADKIRSELKALKTKVGESCDKDLLLAGFQTESLIQSNELKEACAQHQKALQLLEGWESRSGEDQSALQFINQILPAVSASGLEPSADSRTRRLILMNGVEKSTEDLKAKKYRYTIALDAGELSAIPYIHDGYLLGGSRKEAGRGTDCSEFVFSALQGSCSEKMADPATAPNTKQYRLFAEMLRGEIPWDADKIGELAKYRSCFESPSITHDTPPQGMDILVSHQPGERVGHIAWVLGYDAESGNVQTFEAAGGSIGSAVSTQRPVFEPACRRTQNAAKVARADLVILRVKANLDASCPLAH